MRVIREAWRQGVRPLPLAALWPVMALCLVMVRLHLSSLSPHDYWWHLVMGRWIDVKGALPVEQTYLYTLERTAGFFNQPWLGQWLLYRLHDAMGGLGGLWVRSAMVLVLFAALLAWVRRLGAGVRLGSVLVVVMAIVALPVFGVRTQMWALAPYAILVGQIWRAAQGGAGAAPQASGAWWPGALGLWALGAFWANVHGSFVLGPVLWAVAMVGVLLGAGLQGERLPRDLWRRWGVPGLALALGTLCHPAGPGAYGYALGLSARVGVDGGVTEWLPPSPATGYGAFFAVAVLAGTGWLVWCRRGLQLWQVLLYAATLVLAVSGARHAWWWALVGGAVIASTLGGVAAKLERPEGEETGFVQGMVHVALAVAMIAGALASLPGLAGHRLLMASVDLGTRQAGEGAGWMARENAVELVQTLQTEGWRGRLFHDQSLGGMLEYALAPPENPRAVAFVDQRMELIPESVWSEYFALSEAQEGWPRLVARHGMGTMLLDRSRQPRLVAALQGTQGQVPEGGMRWEVRAETGDHMLFERVDAEGLALPWHEGARRLPTPRR